MKIRALSDLHLEFKPWKYEEAGEDIVVLAGDICDMSEQGRGRRDQLLKSIKAPVLVLLGNHEYYGKLTSREDGSIAHMGDLTHHKHVTLLNPGVAVFGDVIFVGATLWTNFLMCKDPQRLKEGVDMAVNDFRWMLAGPSDLARTGPRTNRLITSDDMLNWFLRESGYIEKVIRDNLDKKVVVVTHFMAHPGAVAPQYKGQLLNGYFGSDLRSSMLPNVKAWIFGHTHTACSFQEGATQIVCNPRAYPGEKSGYDPKKVIEV